MQLPLTRTRNSQRTERNSVAISATEASVHLETNVNFLMRKDLLSVIPSLVEEDVEQLMLPRPLDSASTSVMMEHANTRMNADSSMARMTNEKWFNPEPSARLQESVINSARRASANTEMTADSLTTEREPTPGTTLEMTTRVMNRMVTRPIRRSRIHKHDTLYASLYS